MLTFQDLQYAGKESWQLWPFDAAAGEKFGEEQRRYYLRHVRAQQHWVAPEQSGHPRDAQFECADAAMSTTW